MTSTRSFTFLLLALAACSSSVSDETGGGGSGGASPGGAGPGGVGAGGATLIGSPGQCGVGLPCDEGATCEVSGAESQFDCDCDPTGHFFCESFGGGGAPAVCTCTAEIACGTANGCFDQSEEGTCEQTNGYCTRTCECGGSCEMDCSGTGPAPTEGFTCDVDYCDLEYWGSGFCSYSSGACDYTVDCGDQGLVVEGSCT